MKTVLIWDDSIGGHHMEYLHHIYEAAINQPAKFIFVVPEDFVRQKSMMTWSESQNIFFDFMPKDMVESLKDNYFLSSYKRSRVLRDYSLKHRVDEIFLITLCMPYPLLPLFLPKGIKVSGIIYQIYFYKWKKITILEKCKYVLETWSIAKSRCTKRPMVLNDTSAAHYFNKIYHVDKYIPIVDPVIVPVQKMQCCRAKFSISEDSVMFLHFGAMDERKGTLDILDALIKLTYKDFHDKIFFFAGKVSQKIHDEFYSKINEIKQKGIDVIVYDTFCEYSMIDELCFLCDYILIPYKFTELSSGVIGHSAKYGKRLIGPADGVIGKLVKQCPGSYAIRNISPEILCRIIANAKRYSCEPNEKYLTKNSVFNFQSIIMDSILSTRR